jgi:hypothetical protein
MPSDLGLIKHLNRVEPFSCIYFKAQLKACNVQCRLSVLKKASYTSNVSMLCMYMYSGLTHEVVNLYINVGKIKKENH